MHRCNTLINVFLYKKTHDKQYRKITDFAYTPIYLGTDTLGSKKWYIKLRYAWQSKVEEQKVTSWNNGCSHYV